MRWTHITHSDEADAKWVQDNFSFTPLDLKDAFRETFRSKIARRKGYTFLTLMIPVAEPQLSNIAVHECDLFILKDELITVMSHPIASMEELFDDAKNKRAERKKIFEDGTPGIVFRIIDELFEHSYDIVDDLNIEMDALKSTILDGADRSFVSDILRMRHNIMEMRRAWRGYVKILQIMSQTHVHFEELMDDAYELWDVLESQKESIEALEDANETLITHELNGKIQALTIFSAILLPAAVIAGIFGMNARNMPFIGHPLDFWIIIGLIAMTTIVLLFVFSIKKLFR